MAPRRPVTQCFLACVGIVVVLAGCSPAPRYTIERKKEVESPISAEEPPKEKKFRGNASYYAKEFHGRKTASGETYDMNGLTAAHPSLPFNTWLEVKNLTNGRTVIVRVNDRGPFGKDRIIDLSYGAAKEIQMIGTGVQEVEITVLR